MPIQSAICNSVSACPRTRLRSNLSIIGDLNPSRSASKTADMWDISSRHTAVLRRHWSLGAEARAARGQGRLRRAKRRGPPLPPRRARTPGGGRNSLAGHRFSQITMDDEVPRPQPYRVPPEGPRLDLRAWTSSMHRRMRAALGDLAVTASAERVTWRRGGLTAWVEPEGEVWWVQFERHGAFAMPPLCVSRHDAFTAACVAKTMLGFFDARLSVPDHS